MSNDEQDTKRSCRLGADEMVIKKKLYETLAQDLYVPLVKGGLDDDHDSCLQEYYLKKINKKYKDILNTYGTDTESSIISAIINVYADKTQNLQKSFFRQATCIQYLITNNILLSNVIFLRDIEDFMWKLSTQTKECIECWTPNMELEHIVNLKLFHLPFLLTIKSDNYFNICLDICSYDCNCLVTQVMRDINGHEGRKGVNSTRFKKYCLDNYPKEESNISGTHYGLDKYSGLLKELCNYVSKRKQKLKMLVDESLHCFPKELAKICIVYTCL